MAEEHSPDNMLKTMVTPAIKNDIADFWNKYREENNIGDNIILVVIDMDSALEMTLGKMMKIFIDDVLSQRKSRKQSMEKSSKPPSKKGRG